MFCKVNADWFKNLVIIQVNCFKSTQIKQSVSSNQNNPLKTVCHQGQNKLGSHSSGNICRGKIWHKWQLNSKSRGLRPHPNRGAKTPALIPKKKKTFFDFIFVGGNLNTQKKLPTHFSRGAQGVWHAWVITKQIIRVFIRPSRSGVLSAASQRKKRFPGVA